MNQSNQQLTKQNKDYSNKLFDYVRNPQEAEVLKAANGRQLIDMDAEMSGILVDLIAQWRYYVGITDTKPEELIFMVRYLKDYYPKMSVEEIKLAMDMSLKGLLNVESRPFNNFSPLYVSNILNAYLDYKKPLMVNISERYETQYIEQQSIKMTKAEECQVMKQIILDDYNRYKETGEVQDFLSLIYTFLKKTKRLVIDKEMVDNALKYADSMYIRMQTAERTEQIMGMFSKMFERDEESAKKKFSRNYCVQILFSKISIDELIYSITEDEFN